QRGITVNTVSPGWTEDSILNSLPEPAQAAIRDWHLQGWTPMQRLGTPEHVGSVIALLCQPEAAWITGQLIVADGGASLMNSEMPPAMQLASQQPPVPVLQPTPDCPRQILITRPGAGCERAGVLKRSRSWD